MQVWHNEHCHLTMENIIKKKRKKEIHSKCPLIKVIIHKINLFNLEVKWLEHNIWACNRLKLNFKLIYKFFKHANAETSMRFNFYIWSASVSMWTVASFLKTMNELNLMNYESAPNKYNLIQPMPYNWQKKKRAFLITSLNW